MKEILTEYIKHTREREYMSGIERDILRIKKTAEVFTPTLTAIEIVNDLEKQNTELFSNPKKKFLDNSCGDGQFLSEIVIKKMEKSGCTLEQALKTAYGVDLMEDNIIECKKRLAGPNPTKKILNIINKNIVCENALTYDYSFKKSKITKPPQTHNLRPPLEHPYRSL